MPRAITAGLRLRGLNVLTSLEDGTNELEDSALLNRAGALGRVLFTYDSDLLAEAGKRYDAGLPFAGIIYMRQNRVSIGKCVEDLEIISKVSESEDLKNVIVYLPLQLCGAAAGRKHTASRYFVPLPSSSRMYCS